MAKGLLYFAQNSAFQHLTKIGKTTKLEVRVADGDMGKVIGKQGRIAKAIRSVVKAAAAKDDKKVIVDIVQ